MTFVPDVMKTGCQEFWQGVVRDSVGRVKKGSFSICIFCRLAGHICQREQRKSHTNGIVEDFVDWSCM